MSTLAYKICGQGPDLVLLHGWGMHSGIWQPVLDKLAANFRVMLVDLPGHGKNVAKPLQPFTKVVDEVLEIAPGRANWIGWSLGGQVAMRITSQFPERVEKLLLVASNPCFLQRDGWPYAMPPEQLGKFAEGLKADWEKTIQRFLALQFLGSDISKSQLRQLQHEMMASPPDVDALEAGLELLGVLDLREELTQIQLPVQVILGRQDRLVPLALSHFFSSNGIEAHVVQGAGHAPFVSHPDEFVSLTESFFLDA